MEGESGQFQVKSGKIICTEPGRPKNYLRAETFNVKKGEWTAGTIKSNAAYSDDISRLFIYNNAAARTNPKIKVDIKAFKGEKLPGSFSIDGGSFGFFDYDNYGGVGEDGEEVDLDRWRMELEGAFIVPNRNGGEGVGCIAGSDDGGVEVKGSKDERGDYVALCVQFNTEEHEHEVEDDDDEDVRREVRLGGGVGGGGGGGDIKSVYLEMTEENHFKMYKLEDISSRGKYETRATWGKIGTPPMVQVKDFDNRELLDEYFEKQISSKKKKGYQERRETEKVVAVMRHTEYLGDEDRKARAAAQKIERKAKKAGGAGGGGGGGGGTAIVEKVKSGKPDTVVIKKDGKRVELIDLT